MDDFLTQVVLMTGSTVCENLDLAIHYTHQYHLSV